MQDKPRSNDLLIRCIMLLAAFVALVFVVMTPLVQTGDLTMAGVAFCMAVPFTLAQLFFGQVSSLGWLSVIQVIGPAGAEVTVHLVSARRRRTWRVRLLSMVIAWVLVTTITNLPFIILTPVVSA